MFVMEANQPNIEERTNLWTVVVFVVYFLNCFFFLWRFTNILWGQVRVSIFNWQISDEPTKFLWVHTKSCCPIGQYIYLSCMWLDSQRWMKGYTCHDPKYDVVQCLCIAKEVTLYFFKNIHLNLIRLGKVQKIINSIHNYVLTAIFHLMLKRKITLWNLTSNQISFI